MCNKTMVQSGTKECEWKDSNNNDLTELEDTTTSTKLNSGHPNITSLSSSKLHRVQNSLWFGFDTWLAIVGVLILCIFALNRFEISTCIIKPSLTLSPIQLSEFVPNAQLVMWIVYIHLSLLLSQRIEFLMATGRLSWQTGFPCHIVNIITILLVPVLFLTRHHSLGGMLSNLLVCVVHLVLPMKLVSYIQVNKQQRDSYKTHSVVPIFWNLYYFWLSSSLCYQTHPRSSTLSIRINRVIWWALQLASGSPLVLAIIRLLPQLSKDILSEIENKDMPQVIERLLVLTLAANLLWMITFYMMFHVFFNLQSELLMFTERTFFQQWWGAESLKDFWLRWNQPVHLWCSNHVYKPLISHGWSKQQSILTIFFISAVLHEYLVSVSLRLVGFSAFVCMISQVPLCHVTMKVRDKFGGRIGNLVVWLTLMSGHTVGVVVYYYQYQHGRLLF